MKQGGGKKPPAVSDKKLDQLLHRTSSPGLDLKTQDCSSPLYLDGITVVQGIFHCSAEGFDEEVDNTAAPCHFVVFGIEMQLNWIISLTFVAL